jgi:hypothetical protein
MTASAAGFGGRISVNQPLRLGYPTERTDETEERKGDRSGSTGELRRPLRCWRRKLRSVVHRKEA